MKGSVLMGGMLVAAAAAGIGLWYSIERAYYYNVTDVTEVMAYGDAFLVSDYQGIDADTSPLKMRACFKVDWDYFPTDEFKDTATPLGAPKFFKCFNAAQITDDLQSGAATAILADENQPFGFNTFIVQYPDGNAYMWRQINKCGKAQFNGDKLPDGCPDPNAKQESSNLEIDTPEPVKLATANLEQIDATILLLPHASVQPEPIAIKKLMAKVAKTDPLTFNGCFQLDMSFGLLTETYQSHETPEPTRLDQSCFDGDQLQVDLETGDALAFVGEQNIHPGIDRVVAVYGDGRAMAWHQKSKSE